MYLIKIGNFAQILTAIVVKQNNFFELNAAGPSAR